MERAPAISVVLADVPGNSRDALARLIADTPGLALTGQDARGTLRAAQQRESPAVAGLS